MRNLYRQRKAMLTSCLTKEHPPETLKISGRGLHLLLQVQNGMNESELVAAAAKNSVRVYGLSEYCFGKQAVEAAQESNQLVIGYAGLNDRQLSEAIERLLLSWFF